MRLTAYTDFSLRVLTYLGLRRDRLATVHEIAAAYGVSRNHLMKVVHELGRAGFVETVRGRSGGIRLARAPGAIRIGDVVRRMEDDFQVVACFAGNDGGGCVIAPDCRLAGALDEALHAFLGVLDGYTLADLLAAPDRLARHFPNLPPAETAAPAAVGG
jgi:Rrf2 family nitric oxide-sensitive transcriptional repressor